MYNFADIKFSNKIRKENYNQLEQLFFFNKNQDIFYDRIVELIEKYGEPYIEKNTDFITIKLERIETECLFASIGPKLVGVLVYKFNNISKSISVIHIAVDDNFSDKERQYNKLLLINMLNKLKNICYKKFKTNNIKFVIGF